MLEIRRLSAKYGAIQALDNVSLTVPAGSIVSLLGANGAGKTTLLGSIMGLVKQTTGQILFGGQDLRGATTEHVVSSGIALVPEGRQVFGELTVAENLRMGAYLRRGGSLDSELADIYRLFPRLDERRRQHAGTLSGGEQQMVAIGRALMSRPKLLLLDEPSLGLAPILVSETMRLIQKINELGVTILLVEQNARQALAISHHGFVIEKGVVKMAGPARDLLDDPDVVAAYLGGAATA